MLLGEGKGGVLSGGVVGDVRGRLTVPVVSGVGTMGVLLYGILVA